MVTKFIATLTALMMTTSVVLAADYTMATDGGCSSSDGPNAMYVKFKTKDKLHKQRGVVFHDMEWSCKVKRFYYQDKSGPFEGTCWGEDDDGDYHISVHMWLDHEHETLNVSFDGRETVVFSEECFE